MKLYGYWRSTCSWRVRIALAHKRIAHEYVPVNLRREGGGEHRRDEYRAVNPMEQVPTLAWEEGGAARRLGQSLAILGYLEERWPDPPLLPADPYLRAKAWQLAEIVNSGIQPYQNLRLLQMVKHELGGDEAAFARSFIERGLQAFEAEARALAGRFAIGDHPTVADVCLVPQMNHARMYGVDLAALPVCARVEQACAALPAFESAQPRRQVDAPPDA